MARMRGVLSGVTSLLMLYASVPGAASAHEQVTLVLTNAQGTVVAESDSHGNVTYTAAYRPYGKQQIGTSLPGPGYTGHVNDPDTGFVYMQQRYYDSMVGRFLSLDPVSPKPGSIFNFGRYTYANNNPILFVDPTGECGEVSDSTQRMRNASDVSMGGTAMCFASSEGQVDFGTTVGSVPGYSESGASAWRSSNDYAFIKASQRYNDEHGLGYGDDSYMDAATLKAWAMVESGGSKSAFLTDPLQVNNAGDAAPDKLAFLGLSRGQKMTPGVSAFKAMNWWRHKGYVHDASGARVSWRGDSAAFERYNANTRMDKMINGKPVPHYVWYANEILKLRSGM